MKAIHKNRLLKLAKHLRSGKLGHKRFDFRVVNESKNGMPCENECGYRGCAIGEMPIAFPSSRFKFDELGLCVAQQFFDLTYPEAARLFLPFSDFSVLKPTATRKQVAANIEAFVNIKSKQ